MLNVFYNCHEHVGQSFQLILQFVWVSVLFVIFFPTPHSGLKKKKKKVGLCGVARRRKRPNSILDLL